MPLIFEFLILGAVLAGLIAAFMILKARQPDNTAYKIAIGLALAAAFLLFWLNGAVGIIGSSNNDVNMMFFGVIAIGFFGALIVRFRPRGMARVMFATAIAQVLVAVIGLSVGAGSENEIWPRDVILLSTFFTALWAGSALLFRQAAAQEQGRVGTESED